MKFNEIRNERKSDLNILSEKEKYYAHSAPNGQINAESLEEHIKLVEIYFLRLIEYNGIELIIDNLIKRTIEGFSASDDLNEYVKNLFYNSIIYHDFGKINHLFQYEKMKNFDDRIKKRKHNESTHHSSLSTYFFLIHHFQNSVILNLDDTNQTVADFLTTCFAIPIYKHHSSSLLKIESKSAYSDENIGYLKDFLTEFSINLSSENLELFNGMISDLQLIASQVNELKTSFDFFPLFALLKLNYSLLTASDYLATSDYMNGIKLETDEDFGLISKELKEKLILNFDTNKVKKFNGTLIRETETFLSKPLSELLEKSNDNLNFIRQKLGADVLTNIENNKDEKVFYIEAPTGGGKTNMSMVAVRKLLELHPEINKVFYVFPFTTLVTQTANAIKETFDLSDFEIAEVHSKAGFKEKVYEQVNEIDAQYGTEKRNQIDNLFVNYPFTLLTHIKFFDILKSNKKDTNYLLHRLANSIIIIDELQAYNPEHWDKIKYFIAQYADLFNIRFVIMSATLPKIDEIDLSGYKPKRFIPLVENAKEYLQNPNFAGRVEIKTKLLDKKIELDDLAGIVFEKSKQYAEDRNDSFKGSVYTIIEFIFKNSASKFYEAVSQKDKFFDEIFVLSGTILEPRRKYIIEFLKDPENRRKKILLITTQVVEAGVDIDMDLGFKNQSLIDSDEQLAGRINRNINKQNCELYLFKHDPPKSIYGKDLRYEVSAMLKPEEVKQILTEKDFNKLYKKVFKEIERSNNSAYKKGLGEYLDNFKRFDFKAINQDFKLIDSENTCVFVPIDVPLYCYKQVKNFSIEEERFLNENLLVHENMVSGEEIWDLYVSYIQDKEKKFSAKIKILNGIMSKFVFSVFIKKANELKEYCDYNEENADYKFFQYLKLKKEFVGNGNLYDFVSGINEKRLNQSFEFI